MALALSKNNPKAEEIKADNAARQEWNRTADMALISGIAEVDILEVKQTQIHERVKESVKAQGWLPNLFRSIVGKAKDFLQDMIRQKAMPPKPVLSVDLTEYKQMQGLMRKVQNNDQLVIVEEDRIDEGVHQHFTMFFLISFQLPEFK